MSGLIMKYFILKPKGTNSYAKASRLALEAYARGIELENPQLATDIEEWIEMEESQTIEKGGLTE